jgi:CBS domain-containing protein
MLCEDIMQRDRLETIGLDEAVLVAADKMRRRNIGFLPVHDQSGVIVGTLTDRDIALRLVAEDLEAKTPVRSVMTHGVVACRPSDDVHFAEELMGQRHKSRVVCLDPKGRLVGILSLADLARWETDRAGEVLRKVTEREARTEA